MLSQLTQLKTSKPKFRTRKESHQISKDSFLPESSLRTEGPSLTTTSKRNQPSTWFLDLEVVCRFSSRPSLEKPSPSMSNQPTPLRTSRLRSKTRKVFPQIIRDSSLPESSLRMAELSVTTTSKKNQHF